MPRLAKRNTEHGSGLGRWRWVVERSFAWLSQFRRWGMVKEGVDYAGLANRVHRLDLFRAVAQELSLEAPQDDMKKEKLFDGVVFDPAQPEAYARAFSVHNIA